MPPPDAVDMPPPDAVDMPPPDAVDSPPPDAVLRFLGQTFMPGGMGLDIGAPSSRMFETYSPRNERPAYEHERVGLGPVVSASARVKRSVYARPIRRSHARWLRLSRGVQTSSDPPRAPEQVARILAMHAA